MISNDNITEVPSVWRPLWIYNWNACTGCNIHLSDFTWDCLQTAWRWPDGVRKSGSRWKHGGQETGKLAQRNNTYRVQGLFRCVPNLLVPFPQWQTHMCKYLSRSFNQQLEIVIVEFQILIRISRFECSYR